MHRLQYQLPDRKHSSPPQCLLQNQFRLVLYQMRLVLPAALSLHHPQLYLPHLLFYLPYQELRRYLLRHLTHLPIIVDPSHGTGKYALVAPMAIAAVAAGADGLQIEVHNDPANALCDGAQSLTPDQFDEVAKKVFAIREVMA